MALDFSKIEFDLSKLSEKTRDEIVIGVSEGKLPLGRLFEVISGSGSDSEVFREWFDERMEDLADLGTKEAFVASAIKKTVKLIGTIGKRF